jgi:hypothetical protein
MRSLRAAAFTLGLLTVSRAAFAEGPVTAPNVSPPAATPALTAPPPPPMPGIIIQIPTSPASPASPSDPAARLASMQVLVTRLEDPARTYRLVGGLTALGLGVVTVPLSAVMLHRGSSTEMGPVILLGIGVGELIGGTFVLMTPGSFASGYAPVMDRIIAGRKAGEPVEKTLEAAERIWRERAQAAHDGRHALGGIAFAVGLVASGFGVALDVASPIGGLARSDQDGFSAAAFGVGYAAILAGVRSFVFPTPVELSWQAYSSGAVVPPKPSAATVALTGLRPVSLPGGAGMGWGLDF